MNYKLFVRDRVTPKYVEVPGAIEQKTVLNAGPPVIYPEGEMIYQPSDYDIYAADPAQRTRLYETLEAGNTAAEIIAALPKLKSDKIAEVKALRQLALSYTVKNAGVLAIYDENYAAAVAVKNGEGMSIMRDGKTATAFLTGFGSQLGMTAMQFADYIVGENRRVNPTAYQIEQEYLRVCYTMIPNSQDVAQILAAPADYRRFCGL